MNTKPKCIIVTGRPGSGKTTLSRQLGQQLRMPVISRDEIKEGYVNTCGVPHDQLPADTNAIVTSFFFDIVCRYLTSKVSVIIEAAFQHQVWEPHMPRMLEISSPHVVICTIGAEIAAQRHLQRGLTDGSREFYHGDKRVSLYRATGEMAPPDPYVEPDFNVPTIHVSTESGYWPSLEEMAHQIRSQTTQ